MVVLGYFQAIILSLMRNNATNVFTLLAKMRDHKNVCCCFNLAPFSSLMRKIL